MRRRYEAAGIGMALAVVAVALLGFQAYLRGMGLGDVRVFQTGATLSGPHLYDRARQVAFQAPQEWAPFFRAPFYAQVLRLLLPFDFRAAWRLVNLAACLGFLLLLPRALGLRYPWFYPLLAIFFTSFLLNFGLEQDGGILLLVLTLALYLEERGHSFWAGAVLALTLQKPSLFLCLPLALALQRKWRLLGGYALAGSLLGVISLAIVGWRGALDYRALVASYELAKIRMPTVQGVAANFGVPALAWLLGAGTILGLLWAAPRANFRTAFCLGLAASLLLSPNSCQHDVVVLLIPVFYFLKTGGVPIRRASLVFLCPVPHLLYALNPPWGAFNGLAAAAYFGVAVLEARSTKGIGGQPSANPDYTFSGTM